MKFKSVIFTAFCIICGITSSNAASFVISNIVSGPGDTLYANNNGTLMNGGLVSIGYFNSAAINPTDYSSLVANLANFVTVTSAAPGGASVTLGGSFAGYAESPDDGGGSPTVTSIGSITVGNPLLGRNLYIITSGSGGQYGLMGLGIIKDDTDPGGPFLYTSNPVFTPIVGTVVSNGFVGNPGGGNGNYNTFQMAVIPEPSTFLLASLGVLALLRRRR